jgi:uncharacterized protein (TIGR02757 family)
MPIKNLKSRLDYHYRAFDRSQISPDPLEFLHKYKNPYDIEAMGIIASVFAFGNVRQIINVLSKIESITGKSPYEFILSYKYDRDASIFAGIKHRFYTSQDIALFFSILNRVYTVFGSLNMLFIHYYFEEADNIKDSLSFFSKNLLACAGKNPTQGVRFMFPDPYAGSACKRMNLFLRWMVRKDELDFGLWKEIRTSQLLIPVDTHVSRICRELKLTKMSTVCWRMAEEITANLKKYNSDDPVRYDFAICHIGMRKLEL